MAQAAKKPHDIEADWDKRSIQSAIDAAKAVVGDGINQRAMMGSLSDLEWGWIVAAGIFAWIKTKSQQATAEGCGYDIPIRSMNGRDPSPWEAGAVETILPALGEIQGVDWSKPVGEWSKDQIVSFACQLHRLADTALAARDEGASGKITSIPQKQIERELSAANGGPLMSRGEMDDDIPFAAEFR